jgi:Ca2+-binding RTX toxin-like protein
METIMAKLLKGTNRADELAQNGQIEVAIQGLNGADTIVLDRDDDFGGGNFVDAGKGDDTVFNAFEGENDIRLGKGNDTYIGIGFSFFNTQDIVSGGAGADRFFVSTLLSTYLGGNGNDVFFSHGHKNDFDGGAGTDTISYQFRNEDSVIGDEGVTIALGEGGALTGANSRENFASIENAIGSENDDIVAGSEAINVLAGLGGRDEMHGLGGNDIIDGGAGEDVLFGDAGADRFVFNSTNDIAGNGDFLADFSSRQGDKINVSAIDADARQAGDQAFQFIGNALPTGNGGAIFIQNGRISVDVDGDGSAEGFIGVNDVSLITVDDFIL